MDLLPRDIVTVRDGKFHRQPPVQTDGEHSQRPRALSNIVTTVHQPHRVHAVNLMPRQHSRDWGHQRDQATQQSDNGEPDVQQYVGFFVAPKVEDNQIIRLSGDDGTIEYDGW